MPQSVAHWRREGLLQAVGFAPGELAIWVRSFPYLKALQDDDALRSSLEKRAKWQERRKVYEELCSVTGDKRPWSLHHPFDELDRDTMTLTIEAARRVKDLDLLSQPIKQQDLVLLVGGADQIEFLMDLLDAPEERRAKEEFKERKRRALEETQKARMQ